MSNEQKKQNRKKPSKGIFCSNLSVFYTQRSNSASPSQGKRLNQSNHAAAAPASVAVVQHIIRQWSKAEVTFSLPPRVKCEEKSTISTNHHRPTGPVYDLLCTRACALNQTYTRTRLALDPGTMVKPRISGLATRNEQHHTVYPHHCTGITACSSLLLLVQGHPRDYPLPRQLGEQGE